MADSDGAAHLWEEIAHLRREVDSLERKLATLSPEDLAQMQVQLAVLQNSLINLKDHIDRKHRETEVDVEKLDKEKLAKSEARIPHLIIYTIAGASLLGVLWAVFEKIGLPH